jgi:hypothetical protein
VLPLIVALLAVALLLWGRQQNAKRAEEVRQFVLQVCRDVAAGQALTGLLNPQDAFSEQQTIEQLRQVCGDSAAASRVEVEVVDPKSVSATVQANATHAAKLRVDGVERLGLILQHEGDANSIRMTGYWLPVGTSSP